MVVFKSVCSLKREYEKYKFIKPGSLPKFLMKNWELISIMEWEKRDAQDRSIMYPVTKLLMGKNPIIVETEDLPVLEFSKTGCISCKKEDVDETANPPQPNNNKFQ